MLHFQNGITPFHCAVEEERSEIVKYFVEEIKVDITLYDQVMMVYSYSNTIVYSSVINLID